MFLPEVATLIVSHIYILTNIFTGSIHTLKNIRLKGLIHEIMSWYSKVIVIVIVLS